MPSSNPRSSSSGSRRKATRRQAPAPAASAAKPKKAKAPKAPKATKAPKVPKAPKMPKPAKTPKAPGASGGLFSGLGKGRGATSTPRTPLGGSGTSRVPQMARARSNKGGLGSAHPASGLSNVHVPKLSKGLVGFIAGGVAVLAIVALCVVFFAPIFVIEEVQAPASNHLTEETITRLADVKAGTTLLNVNVGHIEENLKRNPWVESVTVDREFPHKLVLNIQERHPFALVAMGTGSTVWYLSQEGYWIEPAQLGGDSESTVEVALAKAIEDNCLLIQGVPASVQPKAATKTTDAPILAVIAYQDGFSKQFAANIMSYTAADEQSISCVLKSGLEVSLGSPDRISSKEAVIVKLTDEHPNQITYINVRNPSKPSYRIVDAASVEGGTGVVAPQAAMAAAVGEGEEEGATEPAPEEQSQEGSQSGEAAVE